MARNTRCWDATDGRNGEAERAVWDTLLQRTITLVLDVLHLAEACELGAWATHLNFTKKI